MERTGDAGYQNDNSAEWKFPQKYAVNIITGIKNAIIYTIFPIPNITCLFVNFCVDV